MVAGVVSTSRRQLARRRDGCSAKRFPDDSLWPLSKCQSPALLEDEPAGLTGSRHSVRTGWLMRARGWLVGGSTLCKAHPTCRPVNCELHCGNYSFFLILPRSRDRKVQIMTFFYLGCCFSHPGGNILYMMWSHDTFTCDRIETDWPLY